MSIKIISANIEGHKHFSRLLPFLKREQADIVCLQEVFKVDLPELSAALQMEGTYVPMAKVTETSVHQPEARGDWGVAQLTRLPVTEQQHRTYFGTENVIPPFFEKGNPNSMNRVILWSTVTADNQAYTVATTHFTWSKDGYFTAEQDRDYRALQEVLDTIPEFVLCGDLNSPRGLEAGNVFSQLSAKYTDHIPPEVKTSIDGDYHKAGQLMLMVDSMFSTSEYQLSDVRVVGGVSDHKAVVGMIEKKV